MIAGGERFANMTRFQKKRMNKCQIKKYEENIWSVTVRMGSFCVIVATDCEMGTSADRNRHSNWASFFKSTIFEFGLLLVESCDHKL